MNKEVAAQTCNVEACLAYLINYFQDMKVEEPAMVFVANRALESIHHVGQCVDEIKANRMAKCG